MAKGFKTGGRKPNTPNKTTASMKAAMQFVYDALQNETGEEHGHFIEWAKGEPTEFYKLSSKLLPLQVDVAHDVSDEMAMWLGKR